MSKTLKSHHILFILNHQKVVYTVKTKKFYPWNYSTKYKFKDLVCHLATPMGILIQPPSVNDLPLPPHLKNHREICIHSKFSYVHLILSPNPKSVWSGHWNSTFAVFLGDQLALEDALIQGREARLLVPALPLRRFLTSLSSSFDICKARAWTVWFIRPC